MSELRYNPILEEWVLRRRTAKTAPFFRRPTIIRLPRRIREASQPKFPARDYEIVVFRE